MSSFERKDRALNVIMGMMGVKERLVPIKPSPLFAGQGPSHPPMHRQKSAPARRFNR